jgi:hypothetical protein
MAKYRCWDRLNQDEEDGKDVDAHYAEAAAEAYADLLFSEEPFDTCDVSVRDGDEVRVFEVRAEQEVVLRANEVDIEAEDESEPATTAKAS